MIHSGAIISAASIACIIVATLLEHKTLLHVSVWGGIVGAVLILAGIATMKWTVNRIFLHFVVRVLSTFNQGASYETLSALLNPAALVPDQPNVFKPTKEHHVRQTPSFQNPRPPRDAAHQTQVSGC